jgi:hypothetical protein
VGAVCFAGGGVAGYEDELGGCLVGVRNGWRSGGHTGIMGCL